MQKNDQKKQELVAARLKEFDLLVGSRYNFESHWQEIAQRMIPSHTNLFNSLGQIQAPGQKKTEFIFDSTAPIALTRFASILDSLLTPRSQTWHRLVADNPILQKNRDVRLWFEEVNRLLFKYRYEPRANFSSQNQQNYKSLGAYGTGAMFIDELSGNPGLRYKNIHLSQVFFVENHQGMVDKAFRKFHLSARQAAQKWGKDNISEYVQKQLATNPEQMSEYVHCVEPRADVDISKKDFRGMPFVSYYICKQGRHLLSEGGYNTFPYAISRYEQAENEIYGRSPAMDVLPAVKTLNEQAKTMLKQGHRALDPVLLVHDDGIMNSFSLRPGAINAGGVNAAGQPLVHALPTGRVDIGKEMMDDNRSAINDAFLITIFQVLTETNAMTATEVLERTKEKGILLAPTVGRQQSEYLGPMIEREIDVLSRQGLLPPMPRMLIEAKGEYKIEYDSPLSRAMRSEEASGLSRTLEQAINVAANAQNPEVLDHFNWDQIIPAMADIQGVPESWLNSMDKIQEIRNGRAQANQQQQMINAAPSAAAMMKAGAAVKKVGGL